MPTPSGASIERRFPYPVEQAWRLFADFARMPTVVPGVSECELRSSGDGVVRHVFFEDHFTDERLDLMDHEAHRIRYTVISSSPDFLANGYSAEMRLSPEGPDACRFTWRSTFTVADGVDPAPVVARLERAYGISVNAFQADLERQYGKR
jgi:hypothetical protein